MQHFQLYLKKLNQQFQTGQAREHSYRAPLQNYLEALLPDDVRVINEPARQKAGAPDFILNNKKGIPIAYVETKDIGKNLDSKDYREQFDRYKAGLDTLIITDYLEFRLYRRGTLTQTVRIAEVVGSQIQTSPNSEWVRQFEYLIQNLNDTAGVNITIRSAENLARRMAGGAKIFADVIRRTLEINDLDFEIADGALSKQYQSFKKILIGDLTHAQFADIYAQTVTYGMFAARLHDTTLEDFSRQEAAELIPKSNPFLRKLFQYVASNDLDDRVRWIVDDLAEVFRHTDVAAILKDFGQRTRQTDPMIHFYETFLAAYDPKLRDQRGVWYTPEPVVQFIVRAVDDILKTEFGLRDGLADTQKINVKVKTDNFDKKTQAYRTVEKTIHRVQLLDPACGTGTFLAQTVRQIHHRFKNQAGLWDAYVGEHLIPRLHGFELLMASYAMAHIKLDLLLRETGFTLTRQNRFKIFLTNALEAHHADAGTLFWSQWLADEAAAADAVKRDAPVMVVVGNPPYSVSSSNKSEWILNLIADYKKDLKEKKINLDDDYIKFIRLGQYFIEKNGEGVLAFISNNSFIDGITHRQMRKSLLETFDKIYILDLHGDAKKKETAKDGSRDQNVFDIMQGVSISLFIKTGKKPEGKLAVVNHFDFYGTREAKYKSLLENHLNTIQWELQSCQKPQFFFVPKDFSDEKIYSEGFGIDKLFIEFNSGLQTKRDDLTIWTTKEEVKKVKADFETKPESDLKLKYNLPEDGRDWTIKLAKEDVLKHQPIILPLQYKVFDQRFTLYTGRSKGFLAYPRQSLTRHFVEKDNLSLIGMRQYDYNVPSYCYAFVTNQVVTDRYFLSSKGTPYIFPLYLYPEEKQKELFEQNQPRRPNLNPEIVEKIATQIGKKFSPEKADAAATFCPLDVLDYVYAVLHTPSYRERYREFLKIDFPRVPLPTDATEWQRRVDLGARLRRLHLLDTDELGNIGIGYPVAGDHLVGKISFGEGRVSINQSQYFENVPEAAWQFYVGGYQPCQKWLKDRVGRRLSFDEIQHYRRLVWALTLTAEVMRALDSGSDF